MTHLEVFFWKASSGSHLRKKTCRCGTHKFLLAKVKFHK